MFFIRIIAINIAQATHGIRLFERSGFFIPGSGNFQIILAVLIAMVLEVIGERFKASLFLMGSSWVLSGLVGLGLGIWAGMYRGSLADRIIKTLSLLMASTPTFWVGLLVLVVFAVELQWFPLGLSQPIGHISSEVTWAQRLHHLVLPALTLSITGTANIVLHTRQKLLDVLDSEYVLHLHL